MAVQELPTDTCVCGFDREFHDSPSHPFVLMRCLACKRPLHLHRLSGLVTARFYCVRHCRQHRWGGHPDDSPFCLKCGLVCPVLAQEGAGGRAEAGPEGAVSPMAVTTPAVAPDWFWNTVEITPARQVVCRPCGLNVWADNMEKAQQVARTHWETKHKEA